MLRYGGGGSKPQLQISLYLFARSGSVVANWLVSRWPFDFCCYASGTGGGGVVVRRSLSLSHQISCGG